MKKLVINRTLLSITRWTEAVSIFFRVRGYISANLSKASIRLKICGVQLPISFPPHLSLPLSSLLPLPPLGDLGSTVSSPIGGWGEAKKRYGAYLGQKEQLWWQQFLRIFIKTRGQSNWTKSASRGAHSPVRGHPRGSKVVPLNSWGRVSY